MGNHFARKQKAEEQEARCLFSLLHFLAFFFSLQCLLIAEQKRAIDQFTFRAHLKSCHLACWQFDDLLATVTSASFHQTSQLARVCVFLIEREAQG